VKKIPSVESLRAAERGRASLEATDDAAAQDSNLGVDEVSPPLVEDTPVAVAEHAPEAAPRKRNHGTSPSKLRQRRRYARERAVQALYQWDVGNSSSSDVLRYFIEQQDMSRADPDYFREAFQGVTHDPAPLDALISPLLDRGFDELDPVERAILRLSAWELSERIDTPVGVVINEAVEVAKRFGAEQGHRFVNGVLDALGRQLRPTEHARTGASDAT